MAQAQQPRPTSQSAAPKPQTSKPGTTPTPVVFTYKDWASI